MKYRVGDKVKIRNDLVEFKQYGSYNFVPYMSKFKGEQIIKELTYNGYTIKADLEGFKWSDEMFEDIEKEKMDKNTLQINMNNLTDEERNTLLSLIEKANKAKSKIWKPKCGEVYYSIDSSGEIIRDCYSNHHIDRDRYSIANCFKTEDEAKFALEKQKVVTELKRFAMEHNEEEIDWSNQKQRKYFIFYSYNYSYGIDIGYALVLKYNTICFTSQEIAERAIKEIGEERIKKYYFEVED